MMKKDTDCSVSWWPIKTSYQIVVPTAWIYDVHGNIIKYFTAGLPAKVNFSMPNSSDYYELEVGKQRIRQTVLFSQ